jgi:hypothetical protein
MGKKEQMINTMKIKILGKTILLKEELLMRSIANHLKILDKVIILKEEINKLNSLNIIEYRNNIRDNMCNQRKSNLQEIKIINQLITINKINQLIEIKENRLQININSKENHLLMTINNILKKVLKK